MEHTDNVEYGGEDRTTIAVGMKIKRSGSLQIHRQWRGECGKRRGKADKLKRKII